MIVAEACAPGLKAVPPLLPLEANLGVIPSRLVADQIQWSTQLPCR